MIFEKIFCSQRAEIVYRARHTFLSSAKLVAPQPAVANSLSFSKLSDPSPIIFPRRQNSLLSTFLRRRRVGKRTCKVFQVFITYQCVALSRMVSVESIKFTLIKVGDNKIPVRYSLVSHRDLIIPNLSLPLL